MEVTQRSARRYDYGAAGPALAPSVTKRRVFRADRPCVGALSLLQNTVTCPVGVQGSCAFYFPHLGVSTLQLSATARNSWQI